MNVYTLKFTLRSCLRDLIRGFWARHVIYPKLSKNEHSLSALEKYLSDINHHTSNKTNKNNAATVNIISSSTKMMSKDNLINDPKLYTLPLTLTTILRNKISTSGSTGRPLTITQDLGTTVREEAFVYRQLRWAGYKHGDRRAWLRGDIVCGQKPYKGLYGCRDWWSNTLMLSSYHLSPITAQSYLDALQQYNPVIIQAYPSSIYALASWMLANKKTYSGIALRGIMTSSETLEADAQKCIEQAFGCRVYDWYGQAERVAAIGTCEFGNHHILTDYGLVELLSEGNGLFEIIGTGYNNKAMQINRYRTGDLVKPSTQVCACKRVFPIVDSIIGRRDKVITLNDGRQISRLGHLFKDMKNIIEGQVVYKGNNHILLRVVPGPLWNESDAQQLIQVLNNRITGITSSIDTVPSIQRGANGKFEFIRIEDET